VDEDDRERLPPGKGVPPGKLGPPQTPAHLGASRQGPGEPLLSDDPWWGCASILRVALEGCIYFPLGMLIAAAIAGVLLAW